MKRIFLTLFAFSLLTTPALWADIPKTLNFQSILTDDNGTIVADGTYSLTFKIWNDKVMGTAIWTETHPTVMTEGGVFSVILGETTTIDTLSFDTQYWLEITLDGPPSETLSPRIQLTASPYSFTVADSAITKNKIRTSAVTSAKIKDGTITTNDIEDGTVGKIDLDDSAVDSSKIEGNAIYGAHITDGTAVRSLISTSGTLTDDINVIGTGGVMVSTSNDTLFIDAPDTTGGIGNLQQAYNKGRVITTTAGNPIDIAGAEGLIVSGSGKVGIGTDSPDDLLTLYKSTDATNARDFLWFRNGTHSTAQMGFKGYNWYLSKTANTADGFVFNVATGNVGIGTASPEQIFEAEDDATWQAVLRNPNETTGKYAGIVFATGSGSIVSTNAMAQVRSKITQATPSSLKANLEFLTNQGNSFPLVQMTIADDGNVGIGTSTPTGLLTAYSSDVETSGNSLALIKVDNASSTDNVLELWNDGTGSSFIVKDGGSTVFDITDGGEVGMGTTSPRAVLEVNGKQSTIIGTDVDLWVEGGNTLSSYAQIGIGYGSGSTNPPTVIAYDVTSASSQTKGDLVFYTRDVTTDTAPSERMRINSNGNVGIGTTLPNSYLHIGDGTSTYRNQILLDSDINRVFFQTNNTRRNFRFSVNDVAQDVFSIDTGSTDDDAVNDTYTSRFAVDTDGNVGIGTSSPSDLLDIRETDNAGVNLRLGWQNSPSNDSAASLLFSISGSMFMGMRYYHHSTASSRRVSINDGSNNERLTIMYDGNVGIGTPSPDRALHVVETSSQVNATLKLDNTVTSNRGTGIQFLSSGTPYGSVGLSGLIEGNTTKNVGIFAETSSEIKFYTNGSATEKVVIDVNGHVLPGSDDAQNLGNTTTRWDTIFVTHTSGTSDKRLKENIQDIPYGLKEIQALRPVTFSWKNKDPEAVSLGLIAQEVRKVVKEIVSVGSDESHTLSMSYTELIPVLIKAVQEQQKQIESKSSAIEKQKAELKSQQEQLLKQQAAIDALLKRMVALEDKVSQATVVKTASAQ